MRSLYGDACAVMPGSLSLTEWRLWNRSQSRGRTAVPDDSTRSSTASPLVIPVYQGERTLGAVIDEIRPLTDGSSPVRDTSQ